jgi:hypothetical protein
MKENMEEENSDFIWGTLLGFDIGMWLVLLVDFLTKLR